ncbi:elo-9 [Pristionchus pacificus]|uniref:Elongation of very long chain fatty acids protein n=1 Tax=Pristionchus pacificus TaxID=54126 RepID=A0A2A6C3J0_PRIPA|nr:elo-9 [Pristionchus pacificus]|eukprot:PDM72603.1 elo-9 [Pristionchus pacificus]
MEIRHYCNATIPCTLEDHRGQLYYFPYKFGSVLAPEHWFANNKEDIYNLIENYWSYSIYVSVFYVLAVQIVQRAMESRKAFELKLPLIIWNSALAVFSLVGTIRMGEEFLHVITTRPLVDSISYAYDPHQPAAFWAFCFSISKFFELGDTMFVLLRKKPLIFLHWYHHAVVLVYAWHCTKEIVAGARWYVFMNYAVHTLMYAYYTVSAAGFRLPRLLSMVITSLQTIQMFIGVAISFIVFYYKLQGRVMQQTYENLFFSFAIYASFAILFSNFFNKSYLKEKEQKKIQ